jgi:hypothetical protein
VGLWFNIMVYVCIYVYTGMVNSSMYRL